MAWPWRAGDATAEPPRATAGDRQRLVEDFKRLCSIESPSRRERAVADVIEAELRGLGLNVREDRSASATGSDAGNLVAVIDAPQAAARSCCARTWTPFRSRRRSR